MRIRNVAISVLTGSIAAIGLAAPAHAATSQSATCSANPNNYLALRATYSDANMRSQTGFTVTSENPIRVASSQIWFEYRDGSKGPQLALTEVNTSAPTYLYENAVNHNNVAALQFRISTGPNGEFLCSGSFRSR